MIGKIVFGGVLFWTLFCQIEPFYSGRTKFVRYIVESSPKPLPVNTEQSINLEISNESKTFLKNITEYGKNRMARRAVGLLQKMRAYNVTPTVLHYTHALWACENSQQYTLGMSVFDEMKLKEIPRSISTYEALVSLAEKTNHLREALDFFDQMKQDTFVIATGPYESENIVQAKSLAGSTNLYNSCLIVCEKLKDIRKADNLYEEMESLNIEKDIVTFTAMIAVCEKVGNADRAIEIFEQLEEKIQQQRFEEMQRISLDPLESVPDIKPSITLPPFPESGIGTSSNPLMRNDNSPLTPKRRFLGVTTDTANLLLWACIKGKEPRQAIKFFHLFNDRKQYPYITPDVNTYNAMIWAHEMIGEAIKAEGYLTVMKTNHIKPQTMTYDGVISAYAKQNQYEPILNLLKCMTNEDIPKSPISYQLAIDCLDRQSNENQEVIMKSRRGKEGTSSESSASDAPAPPSRYSNNHYYFNYINEVYFSALRDGFFNPWVKGTRQLDLRGFLLSICKVAVKSILLSMLEKKLSVFTLEMIVAEERVLPGGVTGDSNDGNEKKEVKEIVSSFDIDLFYDYLSTLHLYSWGENSISPKKELEIVTKQEGNLVKYIINREDVLQWLEMQE